MYISIFSNYFTCRYNLVVPSARVVTTFRVFELVRCSDYWLS